MPAGASHTMSLKKQVKHKLNKTVIKEDDNNHTWEKELQHHSTPKQSKPKEATTIETSDETDTTTSNSVNNPKVNGNNSEHAHLVLKPHCSCSQCVHWTDSKEWIHSPEYSHKNDKKLLCNYKYSFFKKEDKNDLRNILGLEYGSGNNIGNKSKRKVLLHRYVNM